MFKVVITDHGFASVETERKILAAAGASLTVAASAKREDLAAHLRDADALLVQWAQIDRETIGQLERCKVIVRYGIGVDNIDLAAAAARGIAVCNVPDYGIDEVADHAVSLAVALGRQLPQLDRRLRDGVWKLAPVAPLPAFRQMTFATAGFGRIARAALERARGFKFQLAAYDPFVPTEKILRFGAMPLKFDELFERADILSLHLPLTPETRHFVGRERLKRMKRTAIVINTARGPLVDAAALAASLAEGEIAGAGLDVFDPEPLPADSPLRSAPNCLLTSHVAWYSEASVPNLQQKAAEEIVRVIRGDSPLNRLK